MMFQEHLARKVMAGEKTVTRRPCRENPRSPWWVESCRYRVGQRFAVNPGRGVPRVGDAVVVSVERMALGILDGEEARREGFAHPDRFVQVWHEMHGDYDPAMLVWRLEFRAIRP